MGMLSWLPEFPAARGGNLPCWGVELTDLEMDRMLVVRQRKTKDNP